MFKTGFQKKQEYNDARVVSLAKNLLADYSKSHNILHSLEANCGGDETLRRMIGKLRISQALGSRDIATIRNKQFQDLMRIVLLGVSTGANVERALSLFIKRLEYQINANNRMKAKVGAAQTLTKLGMSLFFPLFSGISAVIISSSLGLFGKSSISTYRSFLIIALAYIPIILYLSSAFSHPERDFAANLHALLPPFLFAICIIVFTQVYLANAL